MKKRIQSIFVLLALSLSLPAAEEKDDVITVEAESYAEQTLFETRRWQITAASNEPTIEPDGDPTHLEGASGGAYIEVLPDTRRSHEDKLINGENFTHQGGAMAVLSYPVKVSTPGRYYVWVRAYSTNSEDNGLHFGLNGEWPESGARWQTVRKDGWHWDCNQRTEEAHTGVPMQLWLDIETAGDHEILMSMREDGAEVDQIILARSPEYRPAGAEVYSCRSTGPPPSVRRNWRGDDLRRTQAVAQGHTDTRRTLRERAGQRTEPLHRSCLPRDLHPRERIAGVRRARLFRRRRGRGEFFRQSRHPMAGVPFPGQDRNMELQGEFHQGQKCRSRWRWRFTETLRRAERQPGNRRE